MSLKKMLLLLTILCCQPMPGEPPYDNPLDPRNPETQGDPFRLRASRTAEGIRLIWSDLRLKTVLGYHVYRRVDDVERIDRLASVPKSDTTYVDTTVRNGHRYEYQLTAYDADGAESDRSYLIVDTDPVLIINEDADCTRETTVKLTFLAPAAVHMWISNDLAFSDGAWEPYAGTKSWQLTPGEGIKTIFAKVKDAAQVVSPVFGDSIILDLTPPVARFTVTPDSGTIGETFTFDASASEDNFSTPDHLQFRWDWEDDESYDTPWTTSRSMSHIYTEEGLKVIRLQLLDAAGWTSTATQTIRVITPPMAYIPTGDFLMGNPNDVGDGDEHPGHLVYLDAYWIDTYEVNNAQYTQFLSDGHASQHDSRMMITDHGDGTFTPAPGFELHPVVYVTYDNARAYAYWLGKSLPTEAQWEKAARGGGLRTYPWGDELESHRANYWNSGDPFESSPQSQTTPVGYYNGRNWGGYQTRDSVSPFGLYDMAGNVCEWCLDWYDAAYYSQSPRSDPTGPATGTYRVVRGGSWADEPYHIRAASRSHRSPYEASGTVGFRCAKLP